MRKWIRTDVQSADLQAMATQLRQGHQSLRQRSVLDVLALLDAFSKHLGTTDVAARVEGLAFLSFWLRRDNLQRLVERCIPGGTEVLDGFVERDGVSLKAQPAGLVGHWAAGNIPTQALFSWVLSLVTKNVALVRVSEDNLDATELCLEALSQCAAPSFSGAEALGHASFCHFPHDALELQRDMSMLVDCKVVWGGATAVQTVTSQPRQAHCTELVFGPKYSIGLLARDVLADPGKRQQSISALVKDSVAFEQGACSSPQTVFFEVGPISGEALLAEVADEFRKVARSNPKTALDAATAASIIKTRARWGLAEGRSFTCSSDNDWTVCLDSTLSLKEAVHSRTLFLTQVAELECVIALVSPRIQTIGLAIGDKARALRLADAASALGVSRCVRFGLMHSYDLPWDGHMVLSEFVRWIAVKP